MQCISCWSSPSTMNKAHLSIRLLHLKVHALVSEPLISKVHFRYCMWADFHGVVHLVWQPISGDEMITFNEILESSKILILPCRIYVWMMERETGAKPRNAEPSQFCLKAELNGEISRQALKSFFTKFRDSSFHLMISCSTHSTPPFSPSLMSDNSHGGYRLLAEQRNIVLKMKIVW